MEDMEQ
jgi:hypothetical protein